MNEAHVICLKIGKTWNIKQTSEHHWFSDKSCFYRLQSSQNYLKFSSNDPAYSCLQMDCLSVMIVNTGKSFQLVMEIYLSALMFLIYNQYSYFSLEWQYKYSDQTNNQTNKSWDALRTSVVSVTPTMALLPNFPFRTLKIVRLALLFLLTYSDDLHLENQRENPGTWSPWCRLGQTGTWYC